MNLTDCVLLSMVVIPVLAAETIVFFAIKYDLLWKDRPGILTIIVAWFVATLLAGLVSLVLFMSTSVIEYEWTASQLGLESAKWFWIIIVAVALPSHLWARKKYSRIHATPTL